MNREVVVILVVLAPTRRGKRAAGSKRAARPVTPREAQIFEAWRAANRNAAAAARALGITHQRVSAVIGKRQRKLQRLALARPAPSAPGATTRLRRAGRGGA